MIDIETVDHIGIGVADLDRAMDFCRLFSLVAEHRAQNVSLFPRDPDRNVIKLRGREEDLSALGGVEVCERQNWNTAASAPQRAAWEGGGAHDGNCGSKARRQGIQGW